MTVSYSRDGVSVSANHIDGVLRHLIVEVADAAVTVTARCYGGIWLLKMPGTELHAKRFETIWDKLPQAVRAKANAPWIPIMTVVAEIIDRQGLMTTPGFGYSNHTAIVETEYTKLTNRYGTESGVAVLRQIAGAQGYKVVPDLQLIAADPGCHAYHEVVGGIYDDMVEDGPVSFESLLRASDRLSTFYRELDAGLAEGGGESSAHPSGGESA